MPIVPEMITAAAVTSATSFSAVGTGFRCILQNAIYKGSGMIQEVKGNKLFYVPNNFWFIYRFHESIVYHIMYSMGMALNEVGWGCPKRTETSWVYCAS